MKRTYYIDEIRNGTVECADGTIEPAPTYHLVYRSESMRRSFDRFATLLIPGHFVFDCSCGDETHPLGERWNT